MTPLFHRNSKRPPALVEGGADVAGLSRSLRQYLAEQSDTIYAELELLTDAYRTGRYHEACTVQAQLTAATRHWPLFEAIQRFLDGPSAAAAAVPTYVMSSFFMASLVARLLPAERLVVLTGAKLADNLYDLSAGAPLPGVASKIHVAPSPTVVADVQELFWDAGTTIRCFAHSHPGDSSAATTPSGVDMATARQLEAHYPTIGIIVCAGGFFRAFSAERPFCLSIVGKGYEVLDEAQHTYRIEPRLLSRVQQLDAFVA
jgi:hypothetical protein